MCTRSLITQLFLDVIASAAWQYHPYVIASAAWQSHKNINEYFFFMRLPRSLR